MLGMSCWRGMRFLLLKIFTQDPATPRNIVAGGGGETILVYVFPFEASECQGVPAQDIEKLGLCVSPHSANLSWRAAQDLLKVLLCEGSRPCDSLLFFPSTAAPES